MKNRIFLVSILAMGILFIPQISFADPNFDGLVPVLITALIIFIGLIIMAIVFTIKYFKTGSKKSFLIALTPIGIIYLLSVYLQNNDFSNPWQFIPLIIAGLLFYKRIKEKPESIWPYAILNWIAYSLMAIVAFPLRIFGDNGNIMFLLSRGLVILCYSFFSFLLTKALLQAESKIKTQSIYIKVNLFILASFMIGTLFSLLNFHEILGLGLNLWFNIPWYLKSLIPIAIVCNLTCFITLKYFPEKMTDDESDIRL